MKGRAGEGWSTGGQMSPPFPGLETNTGVGTQEYVQLGLSLPGEVRVAAGFCVLFVFFFSFFFFCKSLKETTVATARHWGWGNKTEVEVGVGWGWEGREVEEGKPRKRDLLSPYAFKSSQESNQKIVTVLFRNCALSGKNTSTFFFHKWKMNYAKSQKV